MGMDYSMVVTAAGKSLFVEGDIRRKRIVRSEKVTTTTGTQTPYPKARRQHFYLSLAVPSMK